MDVTRNQQNLVSWRRNLRVIRKATGTCTSCGAVSARPGLAYCENCAEKRKVQAHNRYVKAREQGLCGMCLKPALPGKAHCADCSRLRSSRAHDSYVKMRDAAFEAYGGKRCVCCGETEPVFLTIDHINGKGAEHRRQLGAGAALYRWLCKKGYPAGFRVLCFNCNSGRELNGGKCPGHHSRASIPAWQMI